MCLFCMLARSHLALSRKLHGSCGSVGSAGNPMSATTFWQCWQAITCLCSVPMPATRAAQSAFWLLSRKLDGNCGSVGSADKQMFGKDCLAMLGRERLATAVLICMLAQSAWALLESCMGSIGSADKQSSGKKQCRLACLLDPKKPDGSCGSVGSVDKQMLGIRHLAALGRKTLLM